MTPINEGMIGLTATFDPHGDGGDGSDGNCEIYRDRHRTAILLPNLRQKRRIWLTGRKAEPKWHNYTAKVLAGCRETFTKVCTAGKTTAVVEGGALTARDILRPPGANIRSGKPPRRAHDHDIFAALLKVS